MRLEQAPRDVAVLLVQAGEVLALDERVEAVEPHRTGLALVLRDEVGGRGQRRVDRVVR